MATATGGNLGGVGTGPQTGRSVRKYRICVLGPSYVGKSSIINRFVNNSFSAYYEPTLKAMYYRKAFNILEDQDVDPQYVELEIIDVFPHDHPLLDKDPDYNDLAREMSVALNDFVKNNYDSIFSKIHGYMFVYDSSNKHTFETLSCLMETIKEIEKSERRGKKVIRGLKEMKINYTPKKIVIGNKKDLKRKKQMIDKNEFKKLEGMRFREVSALTNSGINEAFKVLISDMHSCSILYKEFFDQEKIKNREQEELNELNVSIDLLTVQEYGAKSIKSKKTGMIGMLPFFGCYGGRDDQTDEEEEEKESSEEEGEHEEGAGDVDKKEGLVDKSGREGNCSIF